MYESYYAIEMMMRQRQSDVLKDARERLRAGALPHSRRRPLLSPVLSGIGRVLVAVGNRLEEQAGRAATAASQRACTECGPVAAPR
jgi:hypothetical protein